LAGHASQLALPGLDLKEPAAHAAHAPPFAPEKPALHSHMELFWLAAGKMELVGQGTHPRPYEPAAHGAHAPLAGE